MMRVTARIMGEDYTIRGRAPEEHIERIARYVDGKMLQISEAYPKLGTSRVAVLAAINMADELFKIKEQYEQLTQLLEEEWSQRHGPVGSAEQPPPRAPTRAGRLPGAGAGVQVQLAAFGEPAVAPEALLTGDALTEASPGRPPGGPEPGAGEPGLERGSGLGRGFGSGRGPEPGRGPGPEPQEDEDQ